MSNPFIIRRSWSNWLLLTFHLLLLLLLHPTSTNMSLLLLLCETVSTFNTPSLSHDKRPFKRIVAHLTSIDLFLPIRRGVNPTSTWLLSLLLLTSVRGGASETREPLLNVSLDLLLHLLAQLLLLGSLPILPVLFNETSDIACLDSLFHVFICYGRSSQDSFSWYNTHIHNIFLI